MYKPKKVTRDHGGWPSTQKKEGEKGMRATPTSRRHIEDKVANPHKFQASCEVWRIHWRSHNSFRMELAYDQTQLAAQSHNIKQTIN